MSETPSKRRRKGREAYYRGGDPNDHNPYPYNPGVCHHRIDWLEGWNEALNDDQKAYAAEIERDAMRSMPIEYAIGECDASDSVKEILRRIADHVGMFQ